MICGRFKAINERAALDEAGVGSRGIERHGYDINFHSPSSLDAGSTMAK